MAFEVREFRDEDRQDVRRLRYRTFSADRFEPDADEFYVDDDRRVVAVLDGRVVGHAGAWRFGQFFGGRDVSMAGVAAVIVEPQARGLGAATSMMRRLIEHVRPHGDAISTLYPATTALYRRLGWEFAGSRPSHRLRTRSLTSVPPPQSDVTLRPATAADAEAFQALYLSAAAGRDGWLRLDPRWIAYNAGDLDDEGADEWWAAERGSSVTGYVLYSRETRGTGTSSNRLIVRELVAADADTERALWRMVGSSWTIWPVTEIRGELEPSLLHLVDEAEGIAPEPSGWDRWMTRILDVPAALEARGYPPGLETTVHLDVADRLITPNAGRYVVEIADGAASVSTGGDGAVVTDVGALSAAYTGFASASAWARMGRLAGTGDQIAALDAAFRGPTPTSAHYF